MKYLLFTSGSDDALCLVQLIECVCEEREGREKKVITLHTIMENILTLSLYIINVFPMEMYYYNHYLTDSIYLGSW